ncbi:unnamed protein product [Prunus brigantina]
MEFRPPVGLLIPGYGIVLGNPVYQPNNPPIGLFPRCFVIANVRLLLEAGGHFSLDCWETLPKFW